MAPLCFAPLFLSALLAQGPQRVLREHDIHFLTDPVPQLPTSFWPPERDLLLEAWKADRNGGRETGAVAFSTGTAEEEIAPPGAGLSPESLVTLIRQNIAEDSWANELNTIKEARGTLVVVQTFEVQEAIGKLLETLRGRRALMAVVDVARVPVEALGALATSPQAWIEAREFDEVLERAGAGAARLSLTAYNEGRVSGFTGNTSARLVDHEVNQTGVVPVVNPVVERLPLGLTAEVRPESVAGTDLFKLELRVTMLKETAQAARRSSFFGDVDLAPLTQDTLKTTLFLPAGRAGLAGFFRTGEGLGQRDFAIIARVRPQEVRAETPPRRAEVQFQQRIYDAAFLLTPFPGEKSAWEPETLESLVRANADPEAWRDERAGLALDSLRFLKVTARAPSHEKVRAYLDGLIRDRAVMGILDLRSFEGPFEDLLAARTSALGGYFLPQGWEPGPRLIESLRVVLVGAVGCTLEARGSTTRMFTKDVEVVSGGTGQSVLNLPDPVMQSAGDGFGLEGSLLGPRRSGLLSLDLSLDEVRTRFENSVDLLLPVDIGHLEGTPPRRGPGVKDPAATPALPGTASIPFTVDLPGQEDFKCQVVMSLPAGRAAILKVEAASGGRGRMVVATARTSKALEGGR
jgi:hypothetical protein